MHVNKFVIITFVFILTRILDGYTTYLADPNLIGEANPIESIFHLGWIGLFVANFSIISLCVYATYLYYFSQPAFTSFEAGMHWKDFISVYFFNKKGQFHKIFYALPNTKIAWIAIGHIITLSLTFFGFIIIINNLSARYWYQFHALLWKYHLVYSSMIPLITIVIFIFFKQEYKRYRNLN